jgi:hypothetical protein
MKKILFAFVASFLIILTGCGSKSAVSKETSMEPKGDVSTYLIGSHVSVEDASKALTEAGFDVIATYKSSKKGKTIVFTNDILKTEASKKNRGFAAVLRLLVDDEHNQISITNPVYYGKAFMQDDYNHKATLKILASLNKAFPNLKDSVDKWDFKALATYHFMMGMPYYEEVDILKEGAQADLIAKADKYKKGKKVIFKLKISDTSTLYGYALGKKTSKFVKKIGTQNANILPYCILIEDGKAKALNAKYYIAVSYPQLSMGEFMKIATVPGAIEKDLKKPFK